MKHIIFAGLMIISLTVACGPAPSPSPVHPDVQSMSSPLNQPTMTPPKKTISEAESSPLATPTVASSNISPTLAISRTSAQGARGKTGGIDLPEDVAIVFQRSGGLAGRDERWLIYRDGHIEGPGSKQQVKAEQVQALLETAQTAGFFDLQDSYLPTNPCCDRFTYRLTMRRADKVHTVTTMDAVPGAPQVLQETIAAVNRLLQGG